MSGRPSMDLSVRGDEAHEAVAVAAEVGVWVSLHRQIDNRRRGERRVSETRHASSSGRGGAGGSGSKP